MSFRKAVEDHIEEALASGVLPDSGAILEVEVPNPKMGPQRSGPLNGPVSAPTPQATFKDGPRLPMFSGASKNKQFPAPHFGASTRPMGGASFRPGGGLDPSARRRPAYEDEDVVSAVLSDLEEFTSNDE